MAVRACVSVRDQADEVLKSLDVDGDGTLDYIEFLSAFKLVDRKTGAKTTPVSMAAPHVTRE